MNFARHRQQAERAARRLAVLVALASVAAVVGLDAIATVGWLMWAGLDVDPPQGFHALVLAAGAVGVVGGAWLETRRLREDGARIARRLGARPVDTVADPLHRRLQNLLEELAIAARIGVPRAYVIEDDPTIDALTAGTDPNQAVVVVTRGALLRLTRDELQGVLAHEVSHVVNGDTRLNTRLVGLNHGLQWPGLAGRSLLAQAMGHPARPAGLLRAVPLAIAGGALAVLGLPGELAARAIRAGVGLQRDFFADAQAVAFTRSRDGLGGALRKAAGLPDALRREGRSTRAHRHPYRGSVSHLLLAGPDVARRGRVAHPSLDERLRRLYGRAVAPIEPIELTEAERREPELPSLGFAMTVANAWDDDAADPALVPPRSAHPGGVDTAWLDTVPVSRYADDPAAEDADATTQGATNGAEPVRGELQVDAAVARLVQATREPAGAAALVVALVERPGGPWPAWEDGWSCAAPRHAALRGTVAALPASTLRAVSWPLTELAVARLRPLSDRSREALFVTVRGATPIDGRAPLRGWIHLALLRRRLRVDPPSRGALAGVRADARSVRVLFAAVAQGAQVSEAKAERAANAAIRALDLDPIGGSAGAPGADSVERAIRGAAALPPLARPLLVRQLASLLPGDAPAETRDVLRLLCVAIDAPPPPPPRAVRTRGRVAAAADGAGEDDEAFATIDA